MLLCEEYRTPATLKEALAALRSAPAGTRIAVGATDLLPWAREGRAGDVKLPMVVDLSRAADLSGWTRTEAGIRLGANLALQRFLDDGALARSAPCMPQCAVWFADDQIREQATVVGNLVNASPAADCTPPMLAMNAEVEIARLEGGSVERRRLPLEDFVLGPGEVALNEGEIVSAVRCDDLCGYGGSFQKVGQRRSLVISAVCAAACVRLDQTGERLEDVRLALGGIGPVPVRIRSAEQALAGRKAGKESVERHCVLPDGLIASRTRREYRRHVAKGFAIAAVMEAAAAARSGTRGNPAGEAGDG